jgi:hypothetical protein
VGIENWIAWNRLMEP